MPVVNKNNQLKELKNALADIEKRIERYKKALQKDGVDKEANQKLKTLIEAAERKQHAIREHFGIKENETVEDSRVGNDMVIFNNLYKQYEDACATNDLTPSLANNLKSQMENIRKDVSSILDVIQKKVKSGNSNEETKKILDQLKQDIEHYNNKIAALDSLCTPTEEEAPSSSLDAAYEDLVEKGFKMETGPNPTIAEEYKKALERFKNMFHDTKDKDLRDKWKEAHKIVNDKAKELEVKMARADEETALRQSLTPSGGYFRYAEGRMGDRLFKRLDYIAFSTTWATASTKKEGDFFTGGENEYIIELYDVTFDERGNPIYTDRGKTSTFNSDMQEVMKHLDNPYLIEDDGMMPDIPSISKGNGKRANRGWSKILWKDVPRKAKTIEIPDWTDGGIQELIHSYQEECKAGMTPARIVERKTEMREVIANQTALIKQLEEVYEEAINNSKEEENIFIKELIKIWKQKRDESENTVNSLGEDCTPTVAIERTDTDFDTIYNDYDELCKEGMLPPRFKKEFEDKMEAEITKLTTALNTTITNISAQEPYKETEKGAKQITNLTTEKERLEKLITEQTDKLNELKARTNCFNQINIDARFGGRSDILTEDSRTKILPKLKKIARLMFKFPTLKITIFGDYAGGKFGLSDSELRRDDQKDIKGKTIVPKTIVNSDYDPKSKDSADKEEQTTGDVAMLRALYLKDMLIQLGADDANITTKVGTFNSKQRARITVQ